MEVNKNNEQLFKLRYEFEHVLIPSWYFTQFEDFTDEIKQSEDSIDKLFYKICFDRNIKDEWLGQYECSYAYDEDNDINALIVVCPKTEVSTNCKYIFMLYNNKHRLVFTYEYDNMMGLFGENGESYMICSWDANKTHRNFGKFKGDDYELIEKVKEIFKNDIKEA